MCLVFLVRTRLSIHWVFGFIVVAQVVLVVVYRVLLVYAIQVDLLLHVFNVLNVFEVFKVGGFGFGLVFLFLFERLVFDGLQVADCEWLLDLFHFESTIV